MTDQERSGCTLDDERPLLTYLLLSYNQESFIREAVSGAFSQTYSPLEIILSDDCSADRTFEIMTEMANSYQGPHRIVLNRNPRNLGIGAHMNWAMGTARGEILIGAAGDDVSLPERTERIYAEWVRLGKGICSIYSNAIVIDDEGRQLGTFLRGNAPSHVSSIEEAIVQGGVGVAGCTHSYSRKTFVMFGAMNDQVYAEDAVIAFRNLLFGKIGYIDDVLVKYRSHGGNISMRAAGRPTLENRIREKSNQEAVLLTWLYDIKKAATAGILPSAKAEDFASAIYEQLNLVNIERRFYTLPPAAGVLFLLRELFRPSRVKTIFKMMERRLRVR